MLKLIQRLVANERLLRRIGPAMGEFNPFSPQHRADPHATWLRMREQYPVYRSRALGSWLFTRYDDVLQILRDRNFSADRTQMPVMKVIRFLNRKDPDFTALIERNLLMLEGAEHSRLRGLVSRAFTPRRVAELRPRLEIIVDDLLEAAAERGEMEVVGDLAHPFPVIAIAELLGVPASDRELFRAWSTELVQLLDPFQGKGGAAPLRRAVHELNDYFRGLLDARRRQPEPDLLSAMIAAENDGDRLDERDLLALSALLLVAGHETTGNLIGNSLVALLRNPGERKRLQDEPGLISTAVDEFLRYDSPIQLTDRIAMSDCQVGGQRIKAGQIVGCILAAANRDPLRFEDPERLDVGREDNPHLAFSQGTHFCLGAQLAKLEAEIAIGALLRRFPHFSGPSDPTDWRRSMVLRGPVALPLQLFGAD